MNRAINLLTICRKAGMLTLGFDASKEAMQKNSAKLILLAADVSPKTEKEIRFFAEKSKTTVLKSDINIENFYFGLGKKVGVIGICDFGFADKLSKLISESFADNQT